MLRFVALYIVYEFGSTLIGHKAPERSIPGLIVAAASLVVMPPLARAKRRVDDGIGSGTTPNPAAFSCTS